MVVVLRDPVVRPRGPAQVDLPFWMFRLEEFAEVLFRGREAVPEEVDALRDLIPAAKFTSNQLTCLPWRGMRSFAAQLAAICSKLTD